MVFNVLKKKWPILNKPGRFIAMAGSMVALVIVIIVVGIIASDVFWGNGQDYPVSLKRIKNTFSFVFLKQPPEFYYLDIEKNGKDYRLKKNDIFDISYRDEFVVKGISTDVLWGRSTAVDVEGVGGLDDFGVMLRGVDLVDNVIKGTGKSMNTETVDAGNIAVMYDRKIIASIPMRVIITPQDWLRYAETAENQRTQIEFLKRAIAMNKRDIGVRKSLAALYVRAGMTNKAIAQYSDILALKPNDAGALTELLKCYIHAKENDKAVSTGIKLIKLKPQDASAFANIAYAYSNSGAMDKAIKNYKESLRLNPDDYLVRFKLGESYEKVKDFKNAIEHYRLVMSKAREVENVKLALAGAHLKAGHYDESIKLYREIIAKQPHNASAYANLGLAVGGKGLAKEEIEYYKKAISLNPRDPVVHFNLAGAYEKNNLHKEAFQEYQKVLKINPGDLEALTRLADIELKNKRYKEAIKIYEKVLTSSPKKASIYAHLGYAYGELKKYKQSSLNYEKSIKQGMKDPQVHYNLAYTYEKLGKTKEAMRKYEKLASSQPTMETLDNLADHYMKEKRYDNAIKIYKKMTVLNPKRASAYSSLAYVYGLKNDIEKEIEYYKISLKYDAEDGDVYLHLGAAYEKRGMYEDALKAYRVAYALNPDSNKAAEKIPALKVKILQQKYQES